MAQLNETLETLEKKEEHLQRKIQQELAEAKKFAQTDKRKALAALQRKKGYDARIDKIRQQRNNLEAQKAVFEDMNMNKQYFNMQVMLKNEMKKQTDQMGGVDKVEEVMDDMEEQMQDAHDISEAMSRQMQVPGVEEVDDDELLAELDGLEEEDLAKQLGTVNIGATTSSEAAPSLPTVPQSIVAPTPGKGKVEVSSAEDDELQALAESMKM